MAFPPVTAAGSPARGRRCSGRGGAVGGGRISSSRAGGGASSRLATCSGRLPVRRAVLASTMASKGRSLLSPPPSLLLLAMVLLVRPDGSTQRAPAWRQQIRWQSHGRVYSLFNSAAQFQPPRGTGGQSLYLSAAADSRPHYGAGRWPVLRGPRGPPGVGLARRAPLPSAEDGSGTGLPPERPEGVLPTPAPTPGATEATWGGAATTGARGTPARAWEGPRGHNVSGPGASFRGAQTTLPNGSGARGERGGSGTPGWSDSGGNDIEGAPISLPPGAGEGGSRGTGGPSGDDPRNPFKNMNSIFYNLYPNGRQRSSGAPPNNWRSGYGTRYFHNGEQLWGGKCYGGLVVREGSIVWGGAN